MTGKQGSSPESIVREIKRQTRRKFTAEEKIRIVLEGLHRYSAPSCLTGMGGSPIQAVSDGYLTMLPDVHFRTGSSHSDMLECVEAATRKVIEMGYADPKRIAVTGHSYGGEGAFPDHARDVGPDREFLQRPRLLQRPAIQREEGRPVGVPQRGARPARRRESQGPHGPWKW